MKRFANCGLALRGLVTCLAASFVFLGLVGLAGSSATATPPVATVAANLVTADGQYATIKGRLVWGGDKAPAPVELDLTSKKDPACGKGGKLVNQGLIVDPKTKGVKWGMAYLVKPIGTNPDKPIKDHVGTLLKSLAEKHPQVEIDQVNCEYVPYVVAVTPEQTLLLKSSDATNHNVHLSSFTNEAFNILLPPNGQMTKKLVPEKRQMSLKCDIHPWMQAWIFAFDHPFFAVTGDDGSFEIKGVPPGTYKMVIWEAAVGYATSGGGAGMEVKCEAGKTTDIGEIKLDPAKVKL